MPWIYAVNITREGGDFVVSVRDLPEVCTSGDTLERALDLAADAVDVVVCHRIEKGKELAAPSAPLSGEYEAVLPFQTAAKATLYQIWRASGVSKSELARRMGLGETEVRRILDPHHSTRPMTLDATAKALGYRLVMAPGRQDVKPDKPHNTRTKPTTRAAE